MKRGRPKLVLVEWVDIVRGAQWHDASDPPVDVAKIHTVGWIHSRNKHVLKLVRDVDADTHATADGGASIAIPTGCIVSVRPLSE